MLKSALLLPQAHWTSRDSMLFSTPQIPLFTISLSLVLRSGLSNIPIMSREREGQVIVITSHYLSGTTPVALLVQSHLIFTITL